MNKHIGQNNCFDSSLFKKISKLGENHKNLFETQLNTLIRSIPHRYHSVPVLKVNTTLNIYAREGQNGTRTVPQENNYCND